MKIAEQKLRATSAELETYIYKSSHDMHAPLASILGLINVSRMEVFDPTAVRYIQMIESQVKKLDSVRVEFIKAMHIKDATRLDEEVHVNSMIGDILRDLRMTEGFSRMNINVNVAPGKKLVSNEFLMRTILQNLIENSIKYQDYSRESPQLLIDLEQRGKTTSITIEDNGVGIDPNIQDQIFDMYFKSSELREGSGLGLYLVKKAVEKLDAKMSLRSSPGLGTRFTLSFAQAN
jgi:signal transduction histidine kinase